MVELVQEHPEGIPFSELALLYSIRYNRNLIVSKLGFASLSSFVGSLSMDLVAENETIFHKSHRDNPGPAAPLHETPPSMKTNFFKVRKEGDMTQEELLERVKEVIRVYPAAQTSIAELLNCYYQHFQCLLPLELYMSLYDSHVITQQGAFGQAQARQETVSPASTYCLHNSSECSQSISATWLNCKWSHLYASSWF